MSGVRRSLYGMNIKENITLGIAYRFPLCCVLWYSLVWSALVALLQRCGVYPYNTKIASVIRGDDNAGYVTCPICRNRKIAWYLREDAVQQLKHQDYPLAETLINSAKRSTC